MANLSRKRFLTELHGLLGSLSREELEKRLLSWARELRPEERPVFLDRFRKRERRGTARSPKALRGEIESFVERMHSYAYADGWGWDEEIRDERVWGDESWAVEIDGFLEGARQLYEAGDYSAARDVYEAALKAYDEGLEEGLLAGADPDDLVDADLNEECARYLRCVYLTTDPPYRPDAVVGAWHEPFVRPGAENLRAIIEVDEAELPDWEEFGKGWLEYLETMGQSPPVTDWVREGVRLFRGTKGLEELARSRGANSPVYFIEWVDALRAEERVVEAVDAAVLALDTVPDGLAIRAKLAERLVACAGAVGREDAVDRGLREALWAGPDLPRLLAFLEGGAAFADRRERLAQAADRFRELDRPARPGPGECDPGKRRGSVPPRLWPCVHLLAGEFERLARIAEEAEPLGWSYGDDPAPVAVPFLLYACRGRARTRLPAHLKEEWDNAIRSVDAHWFGAWDGPLDDLFENAEEGEAEPRGEVSERFTPLAHEAIAAARATDADLLRWLGKAEKAALRRVDAIVSNKKRGSYDKAARLLTAVAEVHWTWGDADAGLGLLNRYWNKYSRFSAFRRELREVVKGSPLKPVWA
ncbi:MAG: hypothetical protein Kow0092_30480 [Deferrisomatales bacterium]